jgi:DNA-binding CsgD family transcriptional regulator
VFLSRALVLAYAGRWHDVRELAERWMGEVRLAGKFPTATARLVWAEATRALGHRDVAAAEMQRAAEDLQEMRPLVPLHLARALLTAGDAQAAAEIVNVEDATARMGPRFAAARAILGDVASRLEDSALWERCLESLRGEARPLLVVYAPISVDRVRARLAMRLRRWAEAIEWFEQALAELHAGRAWYEYAQACLDYAEMRRRRRRRGDDTKAAALEAQAKELLISLGIEHDESRPSPGARDGDRFALTGRELEVLDLLSRGLRNQEIADALTLSRRTVERHLENIFAKMDVKSRAEAIVSAVAEGIVAPQMPDQPSLTRDEQGGRLQGSCPSCGVVPSHLQGQYGSRDGARSSRPPAGPG